MRNIIDSLLSIFGGFSYIATNFKRFWKEFSLLFLISFLTFIFTTVLVFFLSSWLLGLLQNLIPSNLINDFEIIKNLLSLLISLILSAYLFSSISIILNSPIYDSISEKVLKSYNSKLLETQTPFFIDILRALFFEIKKFLLLILVLFFTFILNLIPCIGTIVFVIINLFTFIIFTGLDLYNPCLSRINSSLSFQIKYIIKRPSQFWPNILLAGFLSSIPILNILIIPVAVTGSIINFSKTTQE